MWMYEDFSSASWRLVCKDFRRLCGAVPDIVWYSQKMERPPDISDERIVFNGRAGAHAQPMSLTRRHDHEKNRMVCETRGHPYDAFVTGLLFIAKFRSEGVFAITTSAEWSTWTLGRDGVLPGGIRLVLDILGYPPGFVARFRTTISLPHDE